MRARIALALLLALPVWVIAPLPLQDLPSHEQVVALLSHGLEWSGQAARLRIDPTPRPYALGYFLWAGLAWVVGVSLASRLLLSWALVGGFLAGSALVQALDPRKEARGWLVGLFAFSELHYLGFVPFLIALPSALWLLRRRLPREEVARPPELALDAALLLGTYLLHPLAGLACGVLLLAAALGHPQRRRRALEVIGLGLPCLLWGLAVALWGRERPLYPDYGLHWLSPQGLLLGVLGTPVNMHGSLVFWRAGPLAAGLAASCLVAWGLGLAALALPRPRRAPRPAGLGLALLAGGLFVIAFPHAWRNGSLLSLRMLPLWLPLALAALPTGEETPRARALAGGAVVLSVVTALAAHGLAARELRPLDPLLARIPPGALVSPPQHELSSQVVQGFKLRLHSHAVARYHTRFGGLGPGGHVTFGTSPVEVVDPAPADPLAPAYAYALRLAREPPPAGFVAVDTAGAWRLYRRANPGQAARETPR